jgi:L-amino acid N-acyltransferase YncA
MSIAPHIRLARPDDAGAIQAIYAPVVSHTPISFETVAPTVEEMCLRIEQTLKDFPWLVYEDAGEVLGYAYASQHRVRAAYQWSVDVSVYIHERCRRQGIGRKLYTSLFELLRRQGFYNVFAGITLPNPASVALHEAMGMQAIGVYEKVGYKTLQYSEPDLINKLNHPDPQNPPQGEVYVEEVKASIKAPGAWYDVGWWQGVLQTHGVAPTPPMKLADLEIAGWEKAV